MFLVSFNFYVSDSILVVKVLRKNNWSKLGVIGLAFLFIELVLTRCTFLFKLGFKSHMVFWQLTFWETIYTADDPNKNLLLVNSLLASLNKI